MEEWYDNQRDNFMENYCDEHELYQLYIITLNREVENLNTELAKCDAINSY